MPCVCLTVVSETTVRAVHQNWCWQDGNSCQRLTIQKIFFSCEDMNYKLNILNVFFGFVFSSDERDDVFQSLWRWQSDVVVVDLLWPWIWIRHSQSGRREPRWSFEVEQIDQVMTEPLCWGQRWGVTRTASKRLWGQCFLRHFIYIQSIHTELFKFTRIQIHRLHCSSCPAPNIFIN